MIPADLYEALGAEGAAQRQALARITLPLLRPYLLLVLLFRLPPATGRLRSASCAHRAACQQHRECGGYAYLNAMRLPRFRLQRHRDDRHVWRAAVLLGALLLLVLRRPARADCPRPFPCTDVFCQAPASDALLRRLPQPIASQRAEPAPWTRGALLAFWSSRDALAALHRCAPPMPLAGCAIGRSGPCPTTARKTSA